MAITIGLAVGVILGIFVTVLGSGLYIMQSNSDDARREKKSHHSKHGVNNKSFGAGDNAQL